MWFSAKTDCENKLLIVTLTSYSLSLQFQFRSVEYVSDVEKSGEWQYFFLVCSLCLSLSVLSVWTPYTCVLWQFSGVAIMRVELGSVSWARDKA